MDCSAIVLNRLIVEGNIDVWAKLKLAFLGAEYTSAYAAITRHYEKYAILPTFDELEITAREGAGQQLLATLLLINEPDISAEVALDALIDQYTQNQTISMLEKFVDKLPIYDTSEIKENLSNIVLSLDEKTLTTEGVYTMGDIMLFKTADELTRDRVHLGFNNTFDAVLGGVAVEELILIGGERGAGKSIVCTNVTNNQYEMGNTSVYFSIEMIAHEVLERQFSINANVPYMALKNGTLNDSDMLKVITARAEMFEDSYDLVEEYTRHRDRFKFETALVREKQLKPDNQTIIIDDRALSLSSIDLHLGKMKARFGNKFKVAVIDYLNQIVVEQGKSQFDWQPQIVVSKKLKELARKHKVCIICPYQIDATGEARFAKGILDAADIAIIMKPYDKEKGAMGFDTTKIRGGPPIKVTSPINWDTLRISPINMETPEAPKDKMKRAGKKKDEPNEATGENPTDAPW